MTRRRVGILVFDQVEALDFCGPFEVFSVTRLVEDRRREEPSPSEVVLVAETEGGRGRQGRAQCRGRSHAGGLLLARRAGRARRLGDSPGDGNDRLIAWVADRAGRASTLASICTGSLLLGRAGLLDGRRATTHWRALEEMRTWFPAVSVIDGEHVVEDGEVITSAGISAGIDLALRVVARRHGEAVARATARHMEHPYPPKDNRRRV